MVGSCRGWNGWFGGEYDRLLEGLQQVCMGVMHGRQLEGLERVDWEGELAGPSGVRATPQQGWLGMRRLRVQSPLIVSQACSSHGKPWCTRACVECFYVQGLAWNHIALA